MKTYLHLKHGARQIRIVILFHMLIVGDDDNFFSIFNSLLFLLLLLLLFLLLLFLLQLRGVTDEALKLRNFTSFRRYYRYWTRYYGLPVAGWNAGNDGKDYYNHKA